MRPLVSIAFLFSMAVVPSLAQSRVLQGDFITLHTDLPSSIEIDELTKVFDAAVPQWCEYFQIAEASLSKWHVTAYLMSKREVFDQRGLLPANIPNFLHGYQWGEKVWVVNQPSAYYTRHLLLHEGVHAIMAKAFGGAGPAWFMEGTAELLATHQWNNSATAPAAKLLTGIVPDSRDRFPYWGRLRVIRDSRTSKTLLPIESVMRYNAKAHRKVEPYAWSWAALLLMDMYPEYKVAVIKHAPDGYGVSDAERIAFTRSFHSTLRSQWPQLRIRWQMLIQDITYGFDAERNRIDLNTMAASSSGAKTLQLASTKGWQSTGRSVKRGEEISITASGRYSLGRSRVEGSEIEKDWVCEPQGVTIRYHAGHPLGCVLAAVASGGTPGEAKLSPPQIVRVGKALKFQSITDGVLLLKIGDHPGELADNSGTAKIVIE